MNLILCGFGQMGQVLERLAPERGFEIVAVVDPYYDAATHRSMAELDAHPDAVLIDFTVPEAAAENIRLAAERGLNMVVGTTGWHYQIASVEKAVEEAGVGLIHATNFSIGVHVFRRIVQEAAKRIDALEDYDIAIHERHHVRKADSPSGTALTLAQDVMARIRRKKKMLVDTSHERIDPGVLHVTSSRIGNVPGEHTVTLDGPFDQISLTHSARGREGFALGALQAARWIAGKKGVYSMDDMLESDPG